MILLPAVILHLLQAAAAAAPSAVTPFQWAANYIHVIAWPTICYAAIRGTMAVTKMITRLEKTAGQIDQMATNHFPHMESSLAEIVTILRERKTL